MSARHKIPVERRRVPWFAHRSPWLSAGVWLALGSAAFTLYMVGVTIFLSARR